MKRVILATFASLFAASAWAQGPSVPTYAAKVPPAIQTPDTVQTRIGTLKFFDGLPDQDTVQAVYDNLDFGRGVEAFLSGIPATSVYALCEGFSQAGFKSNHGIGITESLSHARSLFLTPNSTVVYVWFCVDLKDGPMVVQTPPHVLGMIDDAYFRYVTDLGVTGPDQGEGGTGEADLFPVLSWSVNRADCAHPDGGTCPHTIRSAPRARPPQSLALRRLELFILAGHSDVSGLYRNGIMGQAWAGVWHDATDTPIQ